MNILDDIQVSGIYFMKNRENGCIYVGCSGFVAARIGQHIADLRRSAHHNTRLQVDFLRYGEDAFDVGILQEVNDRREMQAAEQTFIRAFRGVMGDSLYNTTPAATRYAKVAADLISHLTWLELSA